VGGAVTAVAPVVGTSPALSGPVDLFVPAPETGSRVVTVEEPVVTQERPGSVLAPLASEIRQESWQPYTLPDGRQGTRRVIVTNSGETYVGTDSGYQVYAPGTAPVGTAGWGSQVPVTTTSTAGTAPSQQALVRYAPLPGGSGLRPAPSADQIVRQYPQTYTQANGQPGTREVIETRTATYFGVPGVPGGYEAFGLDGRPLQPGAVQSPPGAGVPARNPGGPIALRPDVTDPLCSASVTSGCIEPDSLYDDVAPFGVADNFGVRRVGQAIVGSRVGPLEVGPLRVGPLRVGSRVGPLIVGPGPVGPVQAASSPVSAPAARPAASRPAAPRPAAPQAQRPNPVGQAISGLQQQGGQLLNRAGQVWNDQPLTVRAVGPNVEVTFMDRVRKGLYTQHGVRISGNGPARVNPLQIATPEHAAQEAGQWLRRGAEAGGNILRNLPPLPMPNPFREAI